MLDLIRHLRPYYGKIIFVLFITVIGTLLTIAGPKISGEATTLLFNGIVSKASGGSGIDFMAIFRILAFLLFIYLLSSLITYCSGGDLFYLYFYCHLICHLNMDFSCASVAFPSM